MSPLPTHRANRGERDREGDVYLRPPLPQPQLKIRAGSCRGIEPAESTVPVRGNHDDPETAVLFHALFEDLVHVLIAEAVANAT